MSNNDLKSFITEQFSEVMKEMQTIKSSIQTSNENILELRQLIEDQAKQINGQVEKLQICNSEIEALKCENIELSEKVGGKATGTNGKSIQFIQ